MDTGSAAVPDGNCLSLETDRAKVGPMSRRASSRTGPGALLLLGLCAVLAGAGGFWLHQRSGDPFRALQVLDVAAYLEDANSLRGNVYKVEGTVQNSLGWSPTGGRLFAFEVEGKAGTEILPVLIPAQFNSVNVQKGQRFHVRIEVIKDGVLVAGALEKS
jgi:hypothetical protein